MKRHYAKVEAGQTEAKTACGIAIHKKSDYWYNTKTTYRVDINPNGELQGRYHRVTCGRCESVLASTPEAKAEKAVRELRHEMAGAKYQARQQMEQAVNEIEQLALDTTIPAERTRELTEELLNKIASASRTIRNAHVKHLEALKS